MHILHYILNMCNIYQTYEQLVHIPKISLTNDPDKISLTGISWGYEPIGHMSGIYQQVIEICLVYDMSCFHISGLCRFILVICQEYNYNGIYLKFDIYTRNIPVLF
jgi:hypothetical protein